MKFSRIDLLTLLISLFIFNAAGQINGYMVDTSTIIVNTVPEDTIATSGLTKTPLGYFVDPVFGISQSDIATNLNLPNQSTYTLPTGTISIDSVRLVLKFADGFYGDSIETRYTVNVYQLNEKYTNGATYYNDKQWNYNSSDLLGTLSFNARTHTSIKIFNIIIGAPDTLRNADPQIRVPINSSFINQNLFNASTTTLNSNTIFQNGIKGLYITIDKNKTTGPGGVFMISSDTLAVYYKASNGLTIDTNQAFLPITNSAAAIRHTYTTTIQSALNNTQASGGTFYLQGLASLRAKISFPNFLQNLRSNLLKKDSDIVINRAELVITPAIGSNIPYSPLPKITMYQLDIAGQRQELQDASAGDARSAGGVSVFGGFYAPNKQNYHFVITAFLQDLLYNKSAIPTTFNTYGNYGTYIGAIDTTNTASVDYLPTPQVAARSVLIGSDKNSPYRITLNVIYTKILKGNE